MTYFEFVKAFNVYLENAYGKSPEVRVAEAYERIADTLEKLVEKETNE